MSRAWAFAALLTVCAAPIRAENVTTTLTRASLRFAPSSRSNAEFRLGWRAWMERRYGEAYQHFKAFASEPDSAPALYDHRASKILAAYFTHEDLSLRKNRMLDAALAEPAIQNYALFEAAQVASPSEQIAFAAQIDPRSRFYEPTARLAADALFDRGDEESLNRARITLSTLSEGPVKSYFLGREAEAAGDFQKAALFYQRAARLAKGEKDAPFGTKAQKRLSRLKFPGFQALLTAGEKVLQAEQTLKERKPKQALALMVALKHVPALLACDYARLEGLALARMRKHDSAIPVLERALTVCDSEKHPALAFEIASSHFTRQRPTQALDWLNQLLFLEPHTEYAEDAHLLKARVHLAQNDRESALAELEEVLNLLESKEKSSKSAEALWLAVEQPLENGVQFDLEALTHIENSRSNRGRIAYFAARSLESHGATAAAILAYRNQISAWPFGYFAYLSSLRLKALIPGAVTSTFEALQQDDARDVPRLPAETIDHPDLEAGLVFLRLHLNNLALMTLRHAFEALNDDQLAALYIARLFKSAGLSGTYERMLVKEQLQLEGIFFDEKVFSQAYPRPYFETYARHAQNRGVPLELVYAISREESRFLPYVRSAQGACGVMQMLPTTAEHLASIDRSSNLPTQVTCRDLANVDLAVAFGTQYLAFLSRYFEGHYGLVVAAYHAGHGRVERWLTEAGIKSPRDVDFGRFVESIPSSQTRNYVKRVLTSYAAYGALLPKAAHQCDPNDISSDGILKCFAARDLIPDLIARD